MTARSYSLNNYFFDICGPGAPLVLIPCENILLERVPRNSFDPAEN